MIIRQRDTDGLGPRLLSLQEAAMYLGITPRSVYRLLEEGLLTTVRLPGIRRILFDRQDLETLVELVRALSASNDNESAGCDGVEVLEGKVRG